MFSYLNRIAHTYAEKHINPDKIAVYMAAEIKQIVEKLDHMQSDIDYIRKHLIDVDSVLTDDDLGSLDQADEDLKEGKAKGL